MKSLFAGFGACRPPSDRVDRSPRRHCARPLLSQTLSKGGLTNIIAVHYCHPTSDNQANQFDLVGRILEFDWISGSVSSTLDGRVRSDGQDAERVMRRQVTLQVVCIRL